MMNKNIFYGYLFALLLCPWQSKSQIQYTDISKGAPVEVSTRLSNLYLPEFGVWMWGENDLSTDNYKRAIDQANEQTPYNFLIPFLRFAHYEVTDEIVYRKVKEAAEYAVTQHVQLVPDLDIRAARRAFQAAHPDELQQMLRLKEVSLADGQAEARIHSIDLNDHYSGGAITHHIALEGKLLRVYAYERTNAGIDPKTIRDITAACQAIRETADSVDVRIPAQAGKKGATYACVMVAFTHFYPDIFGPHLMSFQRQIIEQYKDVPLLGLCKDEWGFPPYYPRFFNEGLFDFWYSPHRAKAYAEDTGGRELLADCFLMAYEQVGKTAERQQAVNRFMEMSKRRNTALEEDFYQATKETFGPDAVVSVHATWWPYPDRCEYLKNGLNWWEAKRDWAQTDEVAPYAVRTALSKKWGSALWYNMYYKSDLAPQVWSSALAGGRIDYLGYQSLFNPDIMRAECRIRMLNYISKAPLDCPVAVVFGHASATNWAGPYYDDVGMDLVDTLWHFGCPADLIPTTEISNGSLRVDADGRVWYGEQGYSALILYHPEFENKDLADFFNKAANGRTALVRLGEWTKDFNAEPVDGNRLLPASMTVVSNVEEAFDAVRRSLNVKLVHKQSPATSVLDNTYFNLRDFNHASYAPPTTGFSRMIDGTALWVAGSEQVSGDTIRGELPVGRRYASIDAVGVAALRLDAKGELEAFAAGSLQSLRINNFSLQLKERVDLALWKDAAGQWQGVIQGWEGELPAELTKITTQWTRLKLPVPPALPRFGR